MGGSGEIAPYLNQSLDSSFNFDLSELILSAVKSGVRSDLASSINSIYSQYDEQAKGQYVDTTFLTNHDQTRIMSEVFEDKAKAKLASSILLTLPGIPFLYYGEELGMIGSKPDEDIRLPFPWYKNGSGKGQTSWRDSFFYSPTNFANALDVQVDDEKSIYNHYKKMIKLRHQNPALASNNITQVDSDTLQIEAYIRQSEKQKLLVAHNLTSDTQTLQLDQEHRKDFSDVLYSSNEKVSFKENKVIIPGNTTVILK
jgi:glycosidase